MNRTPSTCMSIQWLQEKKHRERKGNCQPPGHGWVWGVRAVKTAARYACRHCASQRGRPGRGHGGDPQHVIQEVACKATGRSPLLPPPPPPPPPRPLVTCNRFRRTVDRLPSSPSGWVCWARAVKTAAFCMQMSQDLSRPPPGERGGGGGSLQRRY